MNSKNDFYKVFLDELADMLSCENQIIQTLPKLIKLASSPELKKALTSHLEETKGQVERLESIFTILDLPSKEKTCKGMAGILKEGSEMIEENSKSATLDAIIISAAQKVEHYEIASYGTLRSFASHLELDDKIIELIQDNLDEEGAADKKLSKIADGTIFSEGINTEAAVSGKGHRR